MDFVRTLDSASVDSVLPVVKTLLFKDKHNASHRPNRQALHYHAPVIPDTKCLPHYGNWLLLQRSGTCLYHLWRIHSHPGYILP